jgi:hypothetical protein
MDATKWRRQPPATELSEQRIEFIRAQLMFMLATAATRLNRVADSCGSGVLVMTVEADRGQTELEPHDAKMTDEQLLGFWERKNRTSIDGLPTEIFGERLMSRQMGAEVARRESVGIGS